MFNEGVATMAVGMGTVFGFLIVLWAVVSLLGVVVGYLNKLFPAEVQAVKTAVKTAVTSYRTVTQVLSVTPTHRL